MEPPTEPVAAAKAGTEEEPRYGGFTRFEIELEVCSDRWMDTLDRAATRTAAAPARSSFSSNVSS